MLKPIKKLSYYLIMLFISSFILLNCQKEEKGKKKKETPKQNEQKRLAPENLNPKEIWGDWLLISTTTIKYKNREELSIFRRTSTRIFQTLPKTKTTRKQI